MADTARDNAMQVAKEARKAAENAGLIERRRTRVPLLFAGLVTLGLVTWAFANSPSVKMRLREGAQRARDRMNERRSTWDDGRPSVRRSADGRGGTLDLQRRALHRRQPVR